MTRLAILVLTLLMPAAVSAQSAPRVSVGVSGGIAELRGGSLVPAGVEPAVAARVTTRLNSRLGIDLEGAITALKRGREYNRRADWQWREERRELSAAAYLRVRVFTARHFRVEPVGGLSLLKPLVRGYQRTYNPFTNTYGEWKRGEPGSLGYNGFYAHETNRVWMLAIGSDVVVGNRRVALVPEFRVLVPFAESTSGGPGGAHTRVGLGARFGF